MIDRQNILKLPLTTNKIKLFVDKKEFFDKYSIVSYYSFDAEYKNLAYEQLADTPCLSVTGIRARWPEMQYPGIKFFVLVSADKVADVKASLKRYAKIRSQIDTLEDYYEKLQTRILTSLAINSLGKAKRGKMMYNDGSLLLCDDKNFFVKESRKELVCLKIEVNEYLNLTAKTTTFSNPRTWADVNRHYNCVFQTGKDFDGPLWSGLSVKPVVANKIDRKTTKLEDLFIKKKRFSDKHNIVPYWPYSADDYTHGRLFAICQVVQLVNDVFNPILDLDFEDSKVILYDEYKTKDDTMAFILEYLEGRKIYIEDSFSTKASKEFVKRIKSRFQDLMNNSLVFPRHQEADCLLLKLCEPQDEQQPETYYTKSLYRMANTGVPMQHVIFHGNEREDAFPTSQARRILLELLVKDCLVKRTMPKQMASLMNGWDFLRYKINQGNILGASMKLVDDIHIIIQDTGFAGGMPDKDFDDFAKERLHFDQSEKICGARDYMALIKNGNVFLIIDTEEIPILNVNAIDEGYDKVVNENETLSLFKRVKDAHRYLHGYIGFYLWRTEGLDGTPDGSYSYISGFNRDNIKFFQSSKMDKMPRAKRIFVLHKEKPEEVDSQIKEICGMLKFGLGRWNELMTYPFPFKFLQEYLDDACETTYSKHWKEITSNKNL